MIQHLDFWIYLALGPVIYWLAPTRFRAGILAIMSLSILLMIAPMAIGVMLGIALAVYGAIELSSASRIEEQGKKQASKVAYLLGMRVSTWLFFVVLGYLFWYKYTPEIAQQFFGDSTFAHIAAPLGISYYSFKLMHYALERGHGTLPAHRVSDFLAWLFLMPTFSAGPIERFDHFLENAEQQFRFQFIVEGLTRIAHGLVKRFILVDYVGRLADYFAGTDVIAFAYGMGGQPGIWPVWAYLFLTLISLYLDFSAYSDIAIGMSRLFGLTIMENFNYPLLATSLAEFWRRWHMSLANWCRAYVYMPVIGLTRNPYAATIATFLLVGLWHAGSLHWAGWGLWHGVGLVVVMQWGRFAMRRKISFFRSKIGKITGWAITMIYVALGDALVDLYPRGSFIDALHLMARAFGA